MTTKAEAVVINDGAARVASLASGSVRLVVTSPPFFDEGTEELLRQTRSNQKDVLGAQAQILCFAESMQNVFSEIARVLHKDGNFVLHTKDIRFGDALIPLAAKHESIANDCGFYLATRIYWQPSDRPTRSGRNFKTAPHVGSFRAPEIETFAVLRLLGRSRHRGALAEEAFGESWLSEALWRTPGETVYPRHPHASPPEVMRRLLSLYSVPGDLVLDPFCGGGGFLDVARSMGRDAIGFEIDPRCAEMARRRLTGGQS